MSKKPSTSAKAKKPSAHGQKPAAKAAKASAPSKPKAGKAADVRPAANGKVVPPKAGPLDKKFVEAQRQRLLELRDHVLDQMQGVAQDNLRSRAEGSEASAFGMHQADAGSDAYEKDFALSLLSQEQDALYEIEEALKRIEAGTYGVCEMSGKLIPKVRLEAIPFARFTIECQQQIERENRGRRRWETTPQFMDTSEAAGDEEEESFEDNKE